MYEVSRRYSGHAALRAALARAQSTHAEATLFDFERVGVGVWIATALSPKPVFIGSRANRDILANRGAALVRASADRSLLESEAWKRKTTGVVEPLAAFCRRMRGTRSLRARDAGLRSRTARRRLRRRSDTFRRGSELCLLFRGRGHTAGDIRVHCHRDLVAGFIPGMNNGCSLEWPATLKRLAESTPARVLAGHGPVLRDRRRLDRQARYLEEVNERVSRAPRPPGSDPWVDVAAAMEANVTAIYRALERR